MFQMKDYWLVLQQRCREGEAGVEAGFSGNPFIRM